MDSQFGRVLDSLRTHDLDSDTMTIFVADHGEELLDHGSIGHGANLFEEVVRIPLVIGFPAGAHAGTRVGARASLTDVVPTVLSMLGQSLPPDVDGRDLTQLLTGPTPVWANRELFLSLRTTGLRSHLVRGVLDGSYKYLRRARPLAAESLYDLAQDPAETENLAEGQTDSRLRLADTLDAYLSRKSSGIHLRLVNDFARAPVGCEVRLHTAGRFVDVSGVRLEAEDGFELSDDGQGLRFECRLENRHQSTRAGPRLVPDEDGLVFLVSPPSAPIAVQLLRLADGRGLPLRAGRHRELEAVPFTFEATDAAWAVRDVGELLGDAGSVLEDAIVGAYLGVIRAPAKREDIPKELLERLRGLGYVAG